VKNEEVLQRVEEDRNILHTIKRRTDNRIYHTRVMCTKCLPNNRIEGQIEGTRRGEGRRMQLPDKLKGENGVLDFDRRNIT